MSVTSPIPDQDSGLAFTATGRECFYCGKPLRDPAVHWMGFQGHVYFHPPCVLRLFVRLARDVHETECPEYYGEVRAGLRERRERRR